MGSQPGEDHIQTLQVLFMGFGVYDEVIDIHYNVVDSFNNLLHKLLKGGGSRGEPGPSLSQ